MGARSGRTQTSGLRVKPIARRCGATISSALQIVGVSKRRSVSSRAGVMAVMDAPGGGRG
jgi:hypothetical protein